MRTRFGTRLWRWAGDKRRETARVSVDKHGGYGAAAGAALPVNCLLRKQLCCLFFYFKSERHMPTTRTCCCLCLCAVSLMAAIWQNFIWCYSSSLQYYRQTLQNPLRAYLLPLLIFSSRSPLSPSYLLLASTSLPQFLLSFPFPPPPPKIRPSSVQFSLARVQRRPHYPQEP